MSWTPVWNRLGLEPTNDVAVIRRAYAALIRQYRPDTHPAEFSQIREAYEAAMQLAREEPGVSPEPVGGDERQTHEPGFAPTAPDALPAPEAQPADPANLADLAGPSFDARGWLQALHDCQRDAGDEAARSLLHEQVAGLGLQTIDARLDYEAHLLHWLMASEEPPLAVVFEGARLLRWPERRDDVAQIFGDGGARRLGLLMEMSYEYIYARHFSSNRWHPRLFGTQPASTPRFGSQAHVQSARAMAGYWRQLCATGGLPRLEERLNAVVLRCLQGQLLLSTDVLLALVVAGFARLQVADSSSLWAWFRSLGISVLTGVAFLPLPWLARWSMTTPLGKRVAPLKAYLGSTTAVVGALGVCFAVFMLAITYGDSEINAVVGQVVLALLGVALAGVLLAGIWHLLREIESAAMKAWLALQRSSDAHAFEQVRLTREPGWRSPTREERMRSLPGAFKFGWAERRRARQVQAQRKREAEARAKAEQAASGASGGSSFSWWWILVGLVVLANFFKAVTK